jgi:hypothetical protein
VAAFGLVTLHDALQRVCLDVRIADALERAVHLD